MTDTRTLAQTAEEDLSWVGLALAGALRAAGLASIVVIALLVTPPLLILAVVVIVPAVALAAVAGALALPVLAIRHLHRHHVSHAHAHARVHRLAQWGRADAARAASRLRRLAARAQAKLYVKSVR